MMTAFRAVRWDGHDSRQSDRVMTVEDAKGGDLRTTVERDSWKCDNVSGTAPQWALQEHERPTQNINQGNFNSHEWNSL
jgi:hypothetical protein